MLLSSRRRLEPIRQARRNPAVPPRRHYLRGITDRHERGSLAVVTESREVSGPGQEPFRQSEYVVDTSTGKGDGKQARWRVVVRADGHKIVRTVSSDPDQLAGDETGWEPEGVIWPTWPNTSEDEIALTASPLAEVQEYWSAIGNRLRDSAKWMAAVLGAALAALVGSSPLAGLNSRHLPGIAITFGLVGLAFLGVTMLLVLRVMRPQSVSFTQVQSAQEGNWPFSNSLRTWQKTPQDGPMLVAGDS
jgi:hypothetical protein